MEKLDLQRFELRETLGAGADYEVKAAVDRQTGQEVVLKRPIPQLVARQMHGPVEARTQRSLEFYQEMADELPSLTPIVGYADPGNHDAYFGDSLGQEYTVIIQERAKGIPLVGDVKARILRVPIGLGQKLFALFPLAFPDQQTPFPIHQQLLDVEEGFMAHGLVLLDLMPQNIFYQPATGEISIIDIAALIDKDGAAPSSRSAAAQDIHDALLEILKFYITPQSPPEQVGGYRDPYGLRPVVKFEQELDDMAWQFEKADPEVRNAALYTIAKVRDRSYTDVASFRNDLTAYLDAVRIRNQNLANVEQAKQAWTEALRLLRDDYWRRFRFDPDQELAALESGL